MADAAHPARPRRSHRLRYTIIALLCIGAVVWMVTLMQKNVVFYKTVSEAVGDRAHDGTRDDADRRRGRSRLDQPHRHRRRLQAHTRRRDGLCRAPRHPARAVQDCAPVVADGHWRGRTFVSDQILIKHGSTYNPKRDIKGSCPPDPFGRS